MTDSRLSSLLAAACLTAVLLNPLTAQARPGDGQGRTELMIGTGYDVFGIRHYPDRYFTLRFGALSTDPEAISLGLGGAAYSLPTLQVGVSLGNLVVGAGIEAGVVHIDPDGGGYINLGSIGVDPFVEYYFDGDSFSPFIGGHFGPTILLVETENAFGIQRNEEVFLSGGVHGGVAFFFENFSIAPRGGFDFVYRSDTERAGYDIFVGLDLRGWIDLDGGSRPSRGGGGGGGAVPTSDPEGGSN